MSNVYLDLIEDANGDLVDIAYYHRGCQPAGLKDWPCPEAIDYPVYCANCGERCWSVPLTDDGIQYCEENSIMVSGSDDTEGRKQ